MNEHSEMRAGRSLAPATRVRRALGMLLAGALVAATAGPLEASVDRTTAKWGKRKLNTERLPEELTGNTRAAVERWLEWAKTAGFHLQLSEDGRLLVLAYKKGATVKKQFGYVADTAARFDELVAPYATEAAPGDGEPREASTGATNGSDDTAGADPEDDVYDPFGGGSPAKPAGGSVAAEAEAWGSGAPFVPDDEPVVMIVLKDQEQYEELLRHMVAGDPSLKDWADGAKMNGGFVQLQPPVASLVLSEGHEEWNPENEVVNRSARLLLARRFGPQVPFWALQGFAWRVEVDVTGTIYCFPYRDEFVDVTDHSGWGTELSNLFRSKDRKKRPLSVEDYAHWKRGSYNERYARISWGLVSWCAGGDPVAFSAFLDDLRDYADENNRRHVGGGKWERDENYEVPIEVQRKKLEQYFGADVWEQATEAFKRRKVK